MKIRSTEKPHSFADKLRKAIPIYDLQGLTLGSNNNFTAGIEAVEYGPEEKVDLANLFSVKEWEAKWSLCSHLSVPLYVLTHSSGNEFIDAFQLSVNNSNISFHHFNKFAFGKFPEWWASIKGRAQLKSLYEAGSRTSIFDDLLEKRGLAWGGNIDGFLLGQRSMKPQAILETRITSKSRLEYYDPADYFRYRGGDYKTWEPLILLAKELDIPLFLLTFERRSTRDCLGFAVIDSISTEELCYRNGPPNDNIIQGIERIRQQFKRKLSEESPSIQ